ncbi:MAG: GGDEF domain-containing protein [Eubacterium sp.]|nr:GGDEF domain-containing protein [Eubacterium sp.]
MAKKILKTENSGDRFKYFLIKILILFAGLILLVTAILDFVVLELSGNAMEKNASNLIAANSRQLELNINSYLERAETLSTLLFSDEAYYLYDETDPGLSDYDKIKSEEFLKNRIVDIGLMENYSDFGIIYSDDHKVGWISHGTEDLFPNGGMYEAFSVYTVNSRKQDGWCFGINGSADRIYYVKRLNPNAILVTALYTRELSSVFVFPEELEEMTIRLANNDDTIIYSSETSEIGKTLPKEISFASSDSDYIINSNVCSNGWRVICSVPTDFILRENHRLRTITLLISLGMAVLILIAGLFLITRLSRPMDGMVTSLQNMAEFDRLSGAMNKGAFQEMAETILSQASDDHVHIFVMLDVDNFKQVNDKKGHIYGDQVIARFGRLIRKLYRKDNSDRETLIGRLGGDEFALYTDCIGVSHKDVIQAVREQMDQVLSAFENEFEKEKESCGISLSAGVYVADGSGISFRELYEHADAALYTSKQSGKAQYTLTEAKEG